MEVKPGTIDIIGRKFILYQHSTMWSANEDYIIMTLQNLSTYLSEMLKTYGYLTWETIAKAFDIKTTASEIESMRVLRYHGQEVHFYIYRDHFGPDDAYIIEIMEGREKNEV